MQYMHIADWSVTFLTLAGVANPDADERAAKANFPPLDGLGTSHIMHSRAFFYLYAYART